MDYIPDPIERGEASAERAYDELYLGNGMMKCYVCEQPFPEGDGQTLSADPYAMPACPKCAQECFDRWEKSLPQNQ